MPSITLSHTSLRWFVDEPGARLDPATLLPLSLLVSFTRVFTWLLGIQPEVPMLVEQTKPLAGDGHPLPLFSHCLFSVGGHVSCLFLCFGRHRCYGIRTPSVSGARTRKWFLLMLQSLEHSSTPVRPACFPMSVFVPSLVLDSDHPRSIMQLDRELIVAVLNWTLCSVQNRRWQRHVKELRVCLCGRATEFCGKAQSSI